MAVGLAGATGAVTARNRKASLPAPHWQVRLELLPGPPHTTELHSGRSLHHKTITPSHHNYLAGLW